MSATADSTEVGTSATLPENAESSTSDKLDRGDILKMLAVVAGSIGGAVGAALLVEHFTDDTDAREYSANGTRLTAEILAAFTSLQGFFEGDETVGSAREYSTPSRVQQNREHLLNDWSTYPPGVIAVFEAMPYVWADVQEFWSELNEEERRTIRRNWSPLDEV